MRYELFHGVMVICVNCIHCIDDYCILNKCHVSADEDSCDHFEEIPALRPKE
jgi:hypothetical protein